MSKNVEISLEYYLELQAAQDFLECLQNQGVQHWEGYDGACEEFSERETPIQ